MSDNLFQSLIHFVAKPGMGAAFQSAFRDCGMLSRPREIDGFVSAELRQSTTDPDHFVVLGFWQSAESYAAWGAVSRRGAPPEAMARLSATTHSVTKGELFIAASA